MIVSAEIQPLLDRIAALTQANKELKEAIREMIRADDLAGGDSPGGIASDEYREIFSHAASLLASQPEEEKGSGSCTEKR